MRKILLLVLILGCMKVHAVTRTVIVNNGNWLTAGTWSGNTVPLATDTVIVPVSMRVLVNLSNVFMAPWNNPKAIFVRGTMEMVGNDPVLSNPVTIEVYNGATFYDHTDFAEFYMTPVSRIIVRLGANYLTGFFPGSNILNTSGGVPPNFTIPAPVTPPFTITINNGAIGYVTSVPLPLELISFSVEQQGRRTRLHWQTADEKQTASFDAERSNDGKSFETIGPVAAAGNGTHSYEAIDALPVAGDNLYRLKITDRDGSFTYSDVVKVSFNASGGSVAVYPNPAREQLHITAAADQVLRICNALGQTVRTASIVKGNNTLDIRTLANGLYFLNLEGQQLKFVKDN